MALNDTQLTRLKDCVFTVCKIAQKAGFKLLSISLSKIIFFADREHFFATHEPLTVDGYIHGKYGPYLEELRAAIHDLATQGYICLEKEIFPGHTREFTSYYFGPRYNKYVLTSLSAEDISMLERITIDQLSSETPISMAEATHNHPWRITNDKEPIPLIAQVFAQPVPLTADDIAWASSLKTSEIVK